MALWALVNWTAVGSIAGVVLAIGTVALVFVTRSSRPRQDALSEPDRGAR